MKTVSAVKGIIPLFLLVIFVRSLGASAIATAEVQADFGDQHCAMSSSGAFVRCTLFDPNNLNMLVAQGTANASAAQFSVSATATAVSNGVGSASGSSSAVFDEMVVADGATSATTLIGHYLVSFSAARSGQFSATINQGDGLFSIQDEGSPIGGMINVMSHFAPGVPFEVNMSAHFFASAPEQIYGFIDVELLNFTDQNGDPVSVTTIPEPGSFPIFALLLAICGLRFLR